MVNANVKLICVENLDTALRVIGIRRDSGCQVWRRQEIQEIRRLNGNFTHGDDIESQRIPRSCAAWITELRSSRAVCGAGRRIVNRNTESTQITCTLGCGWHSSLNFSA